jgi:hypothetical protein
LVVEALLARVVALWRRAHRREAIAHLLRMVAVGMVGAMARLLLKGIRWEIACRKGWCRR